MHCLKGPPTLQYADYAWLLDFIQLYDHFDFKLGQIKENIRTSLLNCFFFLHLFRALLRNGPAGQRIELHLFGLPTWAPCFFETGSSINLYLLSG